MKYNVGDKVRVVSEVYVADGFRKGDVFIIQDHESKMICNKTEEFPEGLVFFEDEVEHVAEEDEPAADLTLSVDIPTQAMKEFADHCERAAAALERIKDALK